MMSVSAHHDEDVSHEDLGHEQVFRTSRASHLPWVEKYRPTNLGDIASQGNIISTLDTLLETPGGMPHLLFYGPPGTGKTTTVQAVTRRLFGTSPEAISSNVLELNASDDRGIDVVRNQIKTTVQVNSPPKLVIMDEADAMTGAAQDALRRVIEKYVKYVRFCFICNDISKMSSAIQSRCMLFRFAPLSHEQMAGRLNLVIKEESVIATEDGRSAIFRLSGGDMRKVMNIIQSTSSAYCLVDQENVYRCCGLPTPQQSFELLQHLLSNDFDSNFIEIRALVRREGYSVLDILRSVFEHLMDYEMPKAITIYLLDMLADLETSISSCGRDEVYASALVGIFQVARAMASNK